MGRAGTLPSLLAEHRVGLVLVPSVVPESFCLVISEAWCAGAAVASFAIGAQQERADWAVDDLRSIVRRWVAGELRAPSPRVVATAHDAARAVMALY